MRIDRIALNNFPKHNFYSEFRKLYGDFFRDDEINFILDQDIYKLVADLPNGFHEVDGFTEIPDNYYIALEEYNNFKERFKVLTNLVPNGDDIERVFDSFKATRISKSKAFLTAFEFYISTSDKNPNDIEFAQKIAAIDNEKMIVDTVFEYLESLSTNDNDTRSQRAKTLLEYYK